mmetsp:Transcript_14357/g.34720  ORF Transcript_14357/g.34720 Transcript_14357/m.34720 type:complete len:643 (+) Transcript_14357:325-2253(+)
MPLGSSSEPMYGTVATTLMKQGSSSSSTSSMIGRGVGRSSSSPSSSSNTSILSPLLGAGGGPTQLVTLASVSTLGGYAAWKISLFVYRTVRPKDDDDDVIEEEAENDNGIATTSRTSSSAPLFLTYIRRLLRWMLIDEDDARHRLSEEDHDGADDDDELIGGGGSVITHHGTCHCASIQFQLQAPRLIKAYDGAGKISFRHTQIKAVNFRITSGQQFLTMYYVFSHTGTAKKGAHGFCSRCGVHILYAASKTSPILSINTNCLKDNNNIGKIRLSKKKHTVSNSFAVDSQWNNSTAAGNAFGGGGLVDNSDQLSTISEVTQPFHFQLHSTQDPFDNNRSIRSSPQRLHSRPPAGPAGSSNSRRRYSYNPPSSFSSGGSSGGIYSMEEHPRDVAVGVEVVDRDHGFAADGGPTNDGIPRQLDVVSPPPTPVTYLPNNLQPLKSGAANYNGDDNGGPFSPLGAVGNWVGMVMGRGSSTELPPIETNPTELPDLTSGAVADQLTPAHDTANMRIEHLRPMGASSVLSHVNTSLSDIGDDLASQDMFSLSGDERSFSSSQYPQSMDNSNNITVARRRMRRKHQSMGGLSSMHHQKTVSSPEAQNQMRYFLSRYRESNGGGGGGTDHHSHKSNTTETTAASSTKTSA